MKATSFTVRKEAGDPALECILSQERRVTIDVPLTSADNLSVLANAYRAISTASAIPDPEQLLRIVGRAIASGAYGALLASRATNVRSPDTATIEVSLPDVGLRAVVRVSHEFQRDVVDVMLALAETMAAVADAAGANVSAMLHAIADNLPEGDINFAHWLNPQSDGDAFTAPQRSFTTKGGDA